MEKKFREVKKKYLAEALSFLGFHYMKFTNGTETVYSFEDTDKFQSAFNELIQLRDKLI